MEKACGRNDMKMDAERLYSNSKICSKHFHPADIILGQLYTTAVPKMDVTLVPVSVSLTN